MKRPPPAPKPNPAWQHSPPVPSRDGKVVWVDAMVLHHIHEHYRAAGVPVIQKKG